MSSLMALGAFSEMPSWHECRTSVPRLGGYYQGSIDHGIWMEKTFKIIKSNHSSALPSLRYLSCVLKTFPEATHVVFPVNDAVDSSG